MNRKLVIRQTQLIAATLLVLGTSVAFADDGSMSVLTGDSYAYFNGLDYNPGKFNTPRAAAARSRDAAVKMPMKLPAKPSVKPRDASEQAEKPIMLADRPRITLPSPFRDDTGA